MVNGLTAEMKNIVKVAKNKHWVYLWRVEIKLSYGKKWGYRMSDGPVRWSEFDSQFIHKNPNDVDN